MMLHQMVIMSAYLFSVYRPSKTNDEGRPGGIYLYPPLFFLMYCNTSWSQGSLQEQEESESDSSLSQSPSVQDWLAQARTTRSQQHEDSLQRQRVCFYIHLFLLLQFSDYNAI